jgi:hypothetical protein
MNGEFGIEKWDDFIIRVGNVSEGSSRKGI